MDDSPFNTIPAELRNRIYELALVTRTIYAYYNPHSGKFRARSSGETVRNLAPLAATCKQIRKEAMPILLGQNSFTVRPNLYDNPTSHACTALHGWISGFGDNARLLRHVTVDLGVFDMYEGLTPWFAEFDTEKIVADFKCFNLVSSSFGLPMKLVRRLDAHFSFEFNVQLGELTADESRASLAKVKEEISNASHSNELETMAVTTEGERLIKAFESDPSINESICFSVKW